MSTTVNESLTWRFLDLREGAKVVVLKPFWPVNRPLTERTVSSDIVVGYICSNSVVLFAGLYARGRTRRRR